MIVCWDASAAVKLVWSEPGSGLAAELWRDGNLALASTLIVPEVTSAIERSFATGGLDATTYRPALERWQRFQTELALLDVDVERASEAADVLRATWLRGADAVHLATALEVAASGAQPLFATWDRRLHAAAIDHGLGVAPAAV